MLQERADALGVAAGKHLQAPWLKIGGENGGFQLGKSMCQGENLKKWSIIYNKFGETLNLGENYRKFKWNSHDLSRKNERRLGILPSKMEVDTGFLINDGNETQNWIGHWSSVKNENFMTKPVGSKVVGPGRDVCWISYWVWGSIPGFLMLGIARNS